MPIRAPRECNLSVEGKEMFIEVAKGHRLGELRRSGRADSAVRE
jgi:hypothetical protein